LAAVAAAPDCDADCSPAVPAAATLPADNAISVTHTIAKPIARIITTLLKGSGGTPLTR